jgi:hypothetical protein
LLSCTTTVLNATIVKLTRVWSVFLIDSNSRNEINQQLLQDELVLQMFLWSEYRTTHNGLVQ